MEKERKPSYFSRLKRRRQSKRNHAEASVAKQNQSQLATAEQSQQASLRADLSRGNPARDQKPLRAAMDVNMCPVSNESITGGKKSCVEETQGSIDNSQTARTGSKKEKSKPPGTVEYTVGPDDTLNSIALKFNITPNKLVQLNRLFSRSVLPGQVLFVPDTGQPDDSSASTTHPSQESEKSSNDPKPLGRVLSPGSEDEEPATVKFLKMSCRYFTDGMGVVGGVMIVTPNNIMFDPHKSDPLVIENGCEEYGLICPMEEVVSIALYSDISHMKLKDALPSDLPQDLCPLYRPGEWEDLPSEHELNPFSRFEALGRDKRPIVLDDIEAVITDASKSEGAEKSPSDEGFTELELPSAGNTDESQGDAEGLDDLGLPKQGSPEGLSPSEGAGAPVDLERQHEEEEELRCGGDKHGSKHNCTDARQGQVRHEAPAGTAQGSDVLPAASAAAKPGNLNVTGTKTLAEDPRRDAELAEERRHTRPDSKALNGLKCTVDAAGVEEGPPPPLSAGEAQKQNQEMEMTAWLLKRMQGPIEDMLLSKEEKSKNPPMFLCFKVGKPMRKSFAAGHTSSPAHSYGTQGHPPEYWFAVPQERVDHLYDFFVQWSPDVYGKEAREQGFIVVEKEELNMVDNFFSSPAPKSWEIITVNEARRRQSVGSFEDDELLDLLPVLSDSSLLLEDMHLQKLANYLPARIQGYPWRLAYSTSVHGTSLKTLYRNMADLDSPVLLVIKDMDNQVFGAFSTHPFRISEHCYGTGETFLFSFCPEIRVFQWSGDNSYFVKGSTDSLQMGGGKGHFGLWLDADLYHGSSSPCTTFKNQPLSAQQDFIIQDLEVWTFQ